MSFCIYNLYDGVKELLSMLMPPWIKLKQCSLPIYNLHWTLHKADTSHSLFTV